MVKTLHFQCRGHRFYSWSGNYDPACPAAKKKKKKERKKIQNVLAGPNYLHYLFRYFSLNAHPEGSPPAWPTSAQWLERGRGRLGEAHIHPREVPKPLLPTRVWVPQMSLKPWGGAPYFPRTCFSFAPRSAIELVKPHVPIWGLQKAAISILKKKKEIYSF